MGSVKSISILIAEDDIDDQEFIKGAFIKNCSVCDLQFVKNGMELTEELEQKQHKIPPSLPSLIVLDLNMPLKDGYQSLKEIRDTPELNRIPVVVVTSSTGALEESTCRSLGCNNFFRKPTTLFDYDTMVQKILSGHLDFPLYN